MSRISSLAMIGLVFALAVAVPAEEKGSRPAGGPTVYAWFPHQFNDFETRAIQWPAITHLSFRSVVIQPDGTLQEPQPRSKVKRLVDEAHAHGVRIDVLVWGTTPANSSQYLARHQDQAVKSLLEYVKANRLDGLDMDDETWQERNTVTGASNRPLVSGFFRKLSRVLKTARADYQVFWDSPPVIDRQDKFAQSWPDYQAIAAGIDGFCIMSYCMNPPTIGWTTGAQPVRGGGKVAGHARDYATCIHDYVAATGGRKDKLLLGVSNNLGGTEWDCRSDQPLSPILGRPRRLSPEEARANAQKYGRRFDPRQQVPWYCHRQDGRWIQGWYEDEKSLAAKFDLARQEGLQGACIWVLDGGHEPASTFTAIRRHLRAP